MFYTVYIGFKNLSKKRLFYFLILIIGLIITFATVNTPRLSGINENSYGSLPIISDHLKAISGKPHSIRDIESHEDVKNYILNKLKEYIAPENVEERIYKDFLFEKYQWKYDIKNILATIKGKNETGMLIVAHYDSRGQIARYGEYGNSYGAADDGYGVVTLLEIARLYGKKTDFENSIYLLFTDSEEIDLDGSRLEVENNTNFFDKINLVINVEARGIKGPVCMFETNTCNYKLIKELYTKTNSPFSFSIATSVYNMIPNKTDLMNFKKIKGRSIAALNFAVLDSLYYYHSPRDCYENVNFSSIMHYQKQILPIIEEYASNSKYSKVTYFDSDQNSVFFMILPNTMIHMAQNTETILQIISVFLFFILLIIYKLYFKIMIKRMMICTIWTIATMLDVGVFGYLISHLTAYFGNVPYSFTLVNTNFNFLPFIISIIIVIISTRFMLNKYLILNSNKSINHGNEYMYEIIFSGIFISLTFTILCSFFAKGVAILFFWPPFIFEVLLLIHTITALRTTGIIIVFSLNLLNFILFYGPLFYLFYYALTIGSLPFILALTLLISSMTLPSLFISPHSKEDRKTENITIKIPIKIHDHETISTRN